jgi:protocatechuate 3,4-dioxygenase beta subunit
VDAPRSLAWRVLVILALVSAPTLLGQVRDNVPTPAAPPARISGRVITGETDQPVPRVRVALQAANVAPVLTAEDGTFEISVPSGAGSLRLSKSGFAPVSVDRRALLPNTQLLVQMARGAAVNGVVIDSTGVPAPNVMVRVRRVNDGTPVTGGGGQSLVETNDLGEFRAGNLAAGRYTVEPGGGRGGRGAFLEAFGSPDVVRGLVDGLGDGVNIRQILDLAAGRGAPPAQATPTAPGAPAAQGAQRAAPQDAQGRGRGGRGGRGRGEPAPAAGAQTVDLRAGEEANLTLSFDSPEQLLVDVITSLPRPATAPAGAVVRGRVLGSDTRPLKGAIVRLNPAGNGATGRSAVTDASGVWEMQGVTAGSYRARISKSGLADVEYGQQRSLQPGRIINVGQNSRVSGIDVRMPKPGVIAGSVTNRWGEPVEGLSVHVWQSSFTDGRVTLSEVSGARPRRTDDRGRYRVFNLLPGSYYVVAIEQSQQEGRGPDDDTSGAWVFFPGVTSATSATRIDVDAGQDAAGIDISYVPSPGARIDGYATSSNGQPGRGRAVLAVSQRSGEPLLPVRTARIESTGRFTFSEVPAGDYVVQVVPGGPGQGADGRGGGRGRDPAGGRGRNGGNGANGANGGNGGGFGGGRGAQGNATGNAGGQASAGAAGAGGQAGQAGQTAQAGAAQGGQRGRGAAAAPAAGGNAGAAQGARGGTGGNGGRGGRGAQQLNAARVNAEFEFGTTYVTVNDGDAVAVRVDTSPAITMNGQVVFEGDATNVLPGSVAFSAYSTDGDLSPMVGGRQVRADVRQDGTFTLARLSGPVRLGQTRAPDGWYLKSAMVNGVNAIENPVSLNRGDAAVASVTVTFANGTAGIEGQVVDDRRQPSGEFGVVVFSSDQGRWFSRSPYIKLGSPAQDGTFSVTGLPPGEYLATAIDQIDGGTDFGSWQNPAVLATLAPTAKRFTLAAGQTATTELRLIRR